MTDSTSIPVVMTSSGAVATPPSTLRNTLVLQVAATNPDYTANLPGELIEDVVSTDVGAMAMIDQARVDAINSLTPYGANAFILPQQGAMLGISQGQPTNTSVLVVISSENSNGYVIPSGFIVGDGTNQYVIQDGGIIGTDGSTSPMLAVASQSGSWPVPAESVTQVVTSVPSPYVLTVSNPQAGTPSTSSESVQSYRARIMQATRVAGQGTPDYIQTLVKAVPGVTPRLVSILQSTFGWEVLCGGGDPYQVAFAIYQGTLDLSTIVGSNTSARNVEVTITDGPNQYTLTYVNPPQQVVGVQAIWNTDLPSFTSGGQVNQDGATAIMNYINGIIVGQPLNLMGLQNAFQSAISTILPIENLSALTFTITVNGSVVTPEAGTSLILSDPESYFEISATGITVVQG
jgi:hypothetical protein